MEGITIIYPPDVTDKRMFYYEVPRSALYLLDIAGENNAASQSALEEAEVVVVFLPPDLTEIQNFFNRFSSIIPKALFVFEGVPPRRRSFQYNLKSKYGIDSKNIGFILQNNDYTEACEEGRLELFIKTNLKRIEKESLLDFMTSLKTVANLLYKRSISEAEKEYLNEQGS